MKKKDLGTIAIIAGIIIVAYGISGTTISMDSGGILPMSATDQDLKPLSYYEDKFLNEPIKLDFAFLSTTPSKVQLTVTDRDTIIGRYIATYDDADQTVTITRSSNENLPQIHLTLYDLSRLSGYAEDGRISWIEQLRITSMFKTT